GFAAAGLFIEGIKQLLSSRRTGKEGALKERPAEQPQIALTLSRAIEWHAHAVEQIDNLGRPLRHLQQRRLVRKKIATQRRLIKMHPLAISLLAGDFIAGVDAALRADRV